MQRHGSEQSQPVAIFYPYLKSHAWIDIFLRITLILPGTASFPLSSGDRRKLTPVFQFVDNIIKVFLRQSSSGEISDQEKAVVMTWLPKI